MVHAAFDTTANRKSLILRVTGHAGQAPIGQDIVCAGASMLMYTVAQCISDMYKQGRLEKRPSVRLDGGDAIIVCKPKAEHYAEALHTYHVARVGYTLLQRNYPQYVQVTSGTDMGAIP